GGMRGDAGSVDGSIAPEKKKKMPVVVPKLSIRSSACSTEAVLVSITAAPSPIDAPLSSNVPSPSLGRPWSKYRSSGHGSDPKVAGVAFSAGKVKLTVGPAARAAAAALRGTTRGRNDLGMPTSSHARVFRREGF